MFTNYRKPITMTCKTEGCEGSCSFDSDTFLPQEWTCPPCSHAEEQQMLDDLYQRELARKLVALAEDKERNNNF